MGSQRQSYAIEGRQPPGQAELLPWPIAWVLGAIISVNKKHFLRNWCYWPSQKWGPFSPHPAFSTAWRAYNTQNSLRYLLCFSASPGYALPSSRRLAPALGSGCLLASIANCFQQFLYQRVNSLFSSISGFLTCGTPDISVQLILCCRGPSRALRGVQHLPGLYLLDAVAFLHLWRLKAS